MVNDLMDYSDTGFNVPESYLTLLYQQFQLMAGKRYVQMFPKGTLELLLQDGCKRTENSKGVFHYNPDRITEGEILRLSEEGRENEFLNLGAYSKRDIYVKLLQGEHLKAVTEYTPDGVELRCAVGTTSTMGEQCQYFEETKEPDSVIIVGPLPKRVMEKIHGH